MVIDSRNVAQMHSESSVTRMESSTGLFGLKGTIWMTVNGKSFGGSGRIELLSRIAAHGSITQAAKSMKMSYKAAWDAIDTMSQLAGEPLLERAAGGKGGGGTRLTQRGEQLVANFKIIEHEHRRFVDDLSARSRSIADDLLLLGQIEACVETCEQSLSAKSVDIVLSGADHAGEWQSC